MLRVPLAPGDGHISGLPTKLFGAHLPAWNPYLQAGTFTFKDIGFQSLYLPSILVMAAFPNPFGYNLLILSHYALTGIFTFLFLRNSDWPRRRPFWAAWRSCFRALPRHTWHIT